MFSFSIFTHRNIVWMRAGILFLFFLIFTFGLQSQIILVPQDQSTIQEAINIYAALIVANPEKKDKFKKKMKKLKKQFE